MFLANGMLLMRSLHSKWNVDLNLQKNLRDAENEICQQWKKYFN